MSETPYKSSVVGRVPPRGDDVAPPSNAASGDAAYNMIHPVNAGRLPSTGAAVGRVPPHGVPNPNDAPPRRLRRLHRVWPDRDGNISYLLTICVDGRIRVLDNQDTFQRLIAFLLDSPQRYHRFVHRFVVMPDHIHVIARMGHDAVRLGQWINALKAVVGGLRPRQERPVGAPSLQDPAAVGRVPPRGVNVGPVPSPGANTGSLPQHAMNVDPVPPPGGPNSEHEFTRIPHSWNWQDGFHDHKFRTPESEARKWEYVCLNPVRYHLVPRPEDWPYGGEIFYDDAAGLRLIPGTPPLLETGSWSRQTERCVGARGLQP